MIVGTREGSHSSLTQGKKTKRGKNRALLTAETFIVKKVSLEFK